MTTAPEPTCNSCGAELVWSGATWGQEHYKCPRCGTEKRIHVIRRMPKPGEIVNLRVLWKTRKPMPDEIASIQSFWPAFRNSSVEDLMSRFRGTEEIELGDMSWAMAQPLVEQAWQRGIMADITRS